MNAALETTNAADLAAPSVAALERPGVLSRVGSFGLRVVSVAAGGIGLVLGALLAVVFHLFSGREGSLVTRILWGGTVGMLTGAKLFLPVEQLATGV